MNDASSNISEQLVCDKNSPSKTMCLIITKKGEYCIWQQSTGKCSKANIPYNTSCLSLQGVQVNSNTCTMIEMSFPDYDITRNIDQKQFTENYGYCQYNSNSNTCKIKTDVCTVILIFSLIFKLSNTNQIDFYDKTKCCTESEAIGINSHSCSKYSIQQPGIYCYFEDDRCKELTPEVVNILDPTAVETYYNSKQFKCSQMNRNSCHMIEWSTNQRCVHTGSSCNNINLKQYSSYVFLTESPTITNMYTCFAIEAESQVDKYFTYDEVNQRCKILVLESETPYSRCEDAIGNRNLCLRYTGNNYCKWNSEKLKCETIMNYTQSIRIYIQCSHRKFYVKEYIN